MSEIFLPKTDEPPAKTPSPREISPNPSEQGLLPASSSEEGPQKDFSERVAIQPLAAGERLGEKSLIQIYTGYISGYKPSLPLGVAEKIAQKALKMRSKKIPGGLDEEDIKIIQQLVRQLEPLETRPESGTPQQAASESGPL